MQIISGGSCGGFSFNKAILFKQSRCVLIESFLLGVSRYQILSSQFLKIDDSFCIHVFPKRVGCEN